MSAAATAARALRLLQARLRALADPARAPGQKRYLKSDLEFLGVTVPQLRAARKELERALDPDRAALRAIAAAAFATRSFDLRLAAVDLLCAREALLRPADLPLVIGLVRRSAGWALVDPLAVKVAGPIAARGPGHARRLRAWARDPDFWVRRTALLAQHDALKAGGGDFALFEELAAPLLGEREFFIRKAIGWLLREVSKQRPALAQQFVARHGAQMSGVTRREATRWLPGGAGRKRRAAGRRA